MSKLIPSGTAFGRWTVLESIVQRGYGTRCRCRCECGKEKLIPAKRLRIGVSKSCGCLRADTTSARSRTHGDSATRLYWVWADMVRRCTNPKHHAYRYYGGRGVGVCKRWRHNFVAFRDDMGPRPPGLTLDRIDNSKGYSPKNCRWASRAEQNRNTRRNVNLIVNGTAKCITDWDRSAGLGKDVIRRRLKRGWKLERAVSTPTCPPGNPHPWNTR